MREDAGEILLCGNVWEKRAKCGSLPPDAGELATKKQKIINESTLLCRTKYRTNGVTIKNAKIRENGLVADLDIGTISINCVKAW